MRGKACPVRPFSRAADTTHPHIIISRLKCARAGAGGHGTRLPVTCLGKADDVVTLTLCPNSANGERLDFWRDRQHLGLFERRRHRNWRLLLGDRMSTATYRHEQSEYESDEASHAHV
jgi:hypothetical protein